MHRIDESKQYWNLATCLFLLGNCADGSFYIEEYQKIADKATWEQQKDEVAIYMKDCK